MPSFTLKVLRLARESNNNPVLGAVPSHFLAFTGWLERRYGHRAVWERFLHGVWMLVGYQVGRLDLL